jgi:hypothetical protein
MKQMVFAPAAEGFWPWWQIRCQGAGMSEI